MLFKYGKINKPILFFKQQLWSINLKTKHNFFLALCSEGLGYWPRRISHGALQVNLKEQGQLIRQDEFMVTFRKKKCFRHIFLFQELVLFSKTRKTDVGNDTYIYKQSFKVLPHTLTHTPAGLPVNNSPCDAVLTSQNCVRQLAAASVSQQRYSSVRRRTSPQLRAHSFMRCFKTKATFPFRLSVPHLFIHLLHTDFSKNPASVMARRWTANITSSTRQYVHVVWTWMWDIPVVQTADYKIPHSLNTFMTFYWAFPAVQQGFRHVAQHTSLNKDCMLCVVFI